MALTSFQELQRASEHRESEVPPRTNFITIDRNSPLPLDPITTTFFFVVQQMREALKGANHRSEKFEAEKEALINSMNDQRVNGASATKEVPTRAQPRKPSATRPFQRLSALHPL